MFSDAAPLRSSAARQFLPPQPGYIPVFIQDGETPPDVESIYEVLNQQGVQSDGQENPDSAESEPDPEMDLDENMALRESKDFIVQQLLSGVSTGSLRDNEVQQAGLSTGAKP